MPRIFRARPAPPVGRSINIGVTMYPVAPRPAPVAAVAAPEPPVDSPPGFGDSPVAIYIGNDGAYQWYAVDFYGTPIGVINEFTIESSELNDPPITIGPSYALNCCAIVAIDEGSGTGNGYVNITCLFDGDQTYTALNVPCGV